MDLLHGRPISDKILADLREKIAKEKATPGLAVVLVGSDEASKIYVNLKGKRAQEIGMNFFLRGFSENSSQEEIIAEIKNLNANDSVDGIIVQLPLPEKFNTQEILNVIDLKKDVDGFSFGKQSELEPVFSKAIVKMIKSSGEKTSDKKALAIVNSEKFGEVMKIEFEKEGMEGSYLLAGDLKDKIDMINEFDVVVSAIGKTGLLKGDYFKEGAVVIDGGISRIGDKIFGDVDHESVKDKNIILSPVPGGVGPVTIACLLENVYIAYMNKSIK